ncbi:YfhO family protein [bacterium]|nr:YfhO family protein [bacterium]
MKKSIIINITSFLIPIFIILTACAFNGVFPFGQHTFLYLDSDTQYLNYLNYGKTIFSGENNLFYSFAKNGGSGIVDFASYYLFSPLNLVFLFFHDKYSDIAYQIIHILNSALAGLTFCYMLSKLYKERFSNVIFSTAYALCSFNLNYINSLPSDGIYLLPVAVIGLEKLLTNKKSLFLPLFLFISILIQPFCAYSIILFLIFYFIFKLFLSVEKNLWFEKTKQFIISIFIGCTLSAFWMLPVKFALEEGKYNPFFSFNFNGVFNLKEIFSYIYTGSIGDFLEDNYPNIFIGVIILALCLLYFFNKSFSKKEKIYSAVFLLFLFISMYSGFFLMLWNAFNPYPDGHIYRNIYVFVFFAVLLAYKNFNNLKGLSFKPCLVFTGIFSLLSFYILYKKSYINDSYTIIFDLIILISFFAFLYFFSKNKINAVVLTCIFALFQFSDYVINDYYSIKVSKEFNLSSVDKFKTHYEKIKNIVDYIKKEDNTFFRTEITSTDYDKFFASKYNNMLLKFNVDGISHYSSLGKIYLMHFYKKLGFDIGDNMHILINYNSKMPHISEFFEGIKYIISKEDNNLELKNYTPVNSPSLEVSKPYILYKNENVLPLMFIADKQILDEKINNKNSFFFWNSLLKTLSGKDLGDVYSVDKIDDYYIDYRNYTFNKNYEIKEEKPVYFSIVQKNVPVSFNNLFVNSNQYIFAVDNISVNTTLFGVYPKNSFVDIFLTHKFRYDINNFMKDKLPLSYLINKYYEHVFTIKEMEYLSQNTFAGYENIDIFKKYFDELTKSKCKLKKISSSHLIGSANIEEDGKIIFTTIPYEKDWRVFVNNKKITPEKALNSMLVIPIEEKGEYKIEMKYIPRGLKEGIIISLLSLIFCIFYFRKNN